MKQNPRIIGYYYVLGSVLRIQKEQKAYSACPHEVDNLIGWVGYKVGKM